MRVIECNHCGEPLSAANDEELRSCLKEHLEQAHGVGNDDEAVERAVAANAYEATDS